MSSQYDYSATNDGNWYLKNREKLEQEYRGKWIIIFNREVVAVVDREEDVRKRAIELGLEKIMYYACPIGIKREKQLLVKLAFNKFSIVSNFTQQLIYQSPFPYCS